jgi:hypothetical protein
MASPPPSETCVCGRKSSDHYSIPTLDRDALFCTKRSGHRYVPRSQAADLIREQVKEIARLRAALQDLFDLPVTGPACQDHDDVVVGCSGCEASTDYRRRCEEVTERARAVLRGAGTKETKVQP